MQLNNIEPPANLCEKVLRRIQRERRNLLIKKTIISSSLIVGVIIGGGTTAVFIYMDQPKTNSTSAKQNTSQKSLLSANSNSNSSYSVQYPYKSSITKTIFYATKNSR